MFNGVGHGLIFMLTQLVDKMRVDWTIPATWIISIVFLGIVNLIGTVWFVRGVYSSIEMMEKAIIIDQKKSDDYAAQQHLNELELARQREIAAILRVMLEGIEKRVQKMEDVRKR